MPEIDQQQPEMPTENTTVAGQRVSDNKANQHTSMRPGNGRSFLASLTGFLAIGLVAAVVYFGYQYKLILDQRLSEIENRSAQTSNQYQQLEQQFLNSQQQLQSQWQQQSQSQNSQLAEFRTELLSSREQLAELSGRRDKGWHLEEAYYLLRIANNRLIFLSDVATAISLSEQADQLLADMDEPELFDTRTRLATDIQRLKAIPLIDRTGIAIRVGAMQPRIDGLKLIAILTSEQSAEPTPSNKASTWYEHLAESFRKLGEQWFEVRKHGSGYQPLISVADEQQLRFAMLLTIQTIQFAILHQNDDLYQASLLQLKSRLSNYFDSEDPDVKSLLLQIEQLLEVTVSQGPLQGLAALSSLKDFIRERKSHFASPVSTGDADS